MPPADLYGDELLPGALVGPFQVEEVCHRGEAAVLYRGRELSTRREVALKVLRTELTYSPAALKRFSLECDTLRRLSHPRIVQVLDVGELRDGRPYLAMEWLGGRSLAAELSARGPMALSEASELLAQVVEGLEAAHRLGVVHRDVKAENVVLKAAGGVTLVDFGIAKLVEGPPGAGLTSTGVAMGTPYAMAPEQILGGEVNPRTDVYGLGVMLFQLLTGRAPFEAPSRTELEGLHLKAPPPVPSERAPVPAAVDEVVRRALAKRPEERFESARKFLEALNEAARRDPAPRPMVEGLCAWLELSALGQSPEGEEALLAAQDQLLSEARSRLLAAGLDPVVEGSDFLFAARALPESAAEAELALGQARAALEALLQALTARASSAGLSWVARLRRGHATVEVGPAGERRLFGGPLLDPSWEGPWEGF